ncbi:hypothetical protein ASE14_14080 [Agromyces sp. Root81]|uniref:TadE/TadG family type IV pilus assembly protein n=1 Tax=Agromyces sp. Root81 TaxID=1736601 RepID=UPI0006FDBB02|nr:TadE/TadG family type IV pilus assembly protein [Agromyces sp. Root81]KRC61908.1 hypothetical protein ASE14_14080 [Agromyces sp. Root81]
MLVDWAAQLELVAIDQHSPLLKVPLMSARKNERGAAAVEFALVVPLLLIMLFAIIDVGWVFSQQLAVTTAAREGARVFAIHNSDEDGLAQTKAEARAAELVSGTPTFSYPSLCTSADDDELVMVVTTPLTDLTGWLESIAPGATLKGTGSMRCGG